MTTLFSTEAEARAAQAKFGGTVKPRRQYLWRDGKRILTIIGWAVTSN